MKVKPSCIFTLACLFQIMMSSRGAKAAASTGKKQLYIIRHGQATHNPRAEEARSKGCSHDEFLELMRQDDSLDSVLTDLGKAEAESLCKQISSKVKNKVQLVVSSPLSRAIQTADLAMPSVDNRICVEYFREINGWLQNAKRRTRTDLQQRFPAWDFDSLTTDEDELWTPELESQADCSERGYQGLRWILQRPEEVICLVCHGGILRFSMNLHERVQVKDGRSSCDANQVRGVKERFANTEIRRYFIEWDAATKGEDKSTIVLTEIDKE